MSEPPEAKSPSSTTFADAFPGDSEVASDLRLVHWESTSLGRPAHWPRALLTAVRIMLTSRFSMWMAWGPDLTFFCNDAYRRDTLGAKYPWALGRPARDVWAEIWDDIGPRIESVLRDGIATWDEALLLFLERSGYREETYHTFSYSPLVDDDGTTAGMLCVVVEETERVLVQRRLATLNDLSAQLAGAGTEREVYTTLADVFEQHARDLPFVVAVGLDERVAASDRLLAKPGKISEGNALALTRVLLEGVAVGAGDDCVVSTQAVKEVVPLGDWDLAAGQAVVLPVGGPGIAQRVWSGSACLLAGLNPYRPADETESFARLVARQVSASLGTARSVEAERRRAAELEELDRTKTRFFANVSHEFRTPLTLITGPLASLQSTFAGRDEPSISRELDVIHRNALRLSKLVNSLLEFSRLQAGRAQARFQPVDLAATTRELVGAFTTVVEHAGLALEAHFDGFDEPVYVDPDMWERIVLNLMSNAVKYTQEGSITVELRPDAAHAVLSVSDTGIGIAADEIPHVFERFHRIEHAHARSAEGTGIGLALVSELVALHGGNIDVESDAGAGTTFTVRVPLGRSHLEPDRILEQSAYTSSDLVDAFITESLGWFNPGDRFGDRATIAHSDAPQVLIVDDNADMRSYVQRVLAARFRTRAASDGAEALAAIEQDRPDLVISDVMMPNVDGIALVQALRTDDRFAGLPVILLTAQAGSSAELQAINVGADDYLVKPFSAEDLLNRVDARLLASHDRVRRQAIVALSERVTHATDARGVLAEVHPLISEWFGAAHTTLTLIDDDGAHATLMHEPPFPGGINERYFRISIDAPVPPCAAVAKRAPVIVSDLDDVRSQFPEVLADYRDAGVGATLAVPVLRSTGTPSGSLASSWSRPRSFCDDDVTWYERVAAVVSDALEHLRVADREHQVLREFQQRLLDIDHRSRAAVVAARYEPAGQELLVGGDWYDVASFDDSDALGMTIGDVVGKGLRAATVMAQLRSALAVAATSATSAARVVDIVDRYAAHLPDALCATLTYMVLQPDGTLTWSSAGHPAPLVATGGDVYYLEGGRRPPLAVRTGQPSGSEATLTLPPASLVLLYTDGLVERRRESSAIGGQRLAELVRSNAHLTLDDLCDELLERMKPAGGYEDDVALLALRTAGVRADHFVDVIHADAASIRHARARLRSWLADHVADLRVINDTLLAVGEACDNAVEHGLRFDHRQVVGIEVTLDDSTLRAAVTDHGRWDGDSSKSAQRGRGRGFVVMSRTMDEVEVRRGPVGTTILFSRSVDRDR